MGPLAAPIIGAVGSIFGGLLGKPKPGLDPRKSLLSHLDGVMEGAQKHGLNPLTVLGSVGGPSYGPATDNSAMGRGIADAALLLGDGLAAQGALRGQLNQAQEANRALVKRVENMTLRPKVPGLYGLGGEAGAAMVSHAPVTTGGVGLPPASGPAGMPIGLNVDNATRRGAVYETGAGDMPVVVRGNNDDRVEEISPVVNEPAYKVIDLFGQDLFVWNDEASENELMATLSSMSLPFQSLYATSKKQAERERSRRKAGQPEPEPWVVIPPGAKRPPPEKRINLMTWPWDGLNPFGPAYRGTN